MLVYDQLDAPNLASAELVARHIQLLEDHDRRLEDQGGGKKDGSLAAGSEDAHLYLGLTNMRGGYCISPKLQEFVASELQKESAVLRERRKAQEERQLARGGPPDKK